MSRPRCLHFTMPWCDTWMSFNISFLLLWGTISFCALNNNPSIADISSLHDQYSRTANGSSCLWQGHPLRTTVLKTYRVGSAAVACWNAQYLFREMGRWGVSWTSFTSKSEMRLSLVSSKYALLSASATESSDPGTYFTFNSYYCNISIIFCSFSVASCKGLFKMYCSGLGSVSSSVVLP